MYLEFTGLEETNAVCVVLTACSHKCLTPCLQSAPILICLTLLSHAVLGGKPGVCILHETGDFLVFTVPAPQLCDLCLLS